MITSLLLLLLLGAFLPLACGHGAVSFPRPRNAIDGSIAPWSNWSFPCDATHKGADCAIHFSESGTDSQGSCPVANGQKGGLRSNGQACYWVSGSSPAAWNALHTATRTVPVASPAFDQFSNGCTIGCDKCDGKNNHIGHGKQQFLYKGMSRSEMAKKKIFMENPWVRDV